MRMTVLPWRCWPWGCMRIFTGILRGNAHAEWFYRTDWKTVRRIV
jgi:hypothetical protein